MGSFLDAQNHGFQWIELDVVTTKDQEIVCSHNFDLERETMGSGYITDLNNKSLYPIIIEHNSLYDDQSILPNLIDVFKNLDSHIKINVEVKSPFASDLRTARAL